MKEPEILQAAEKSLANLWGTQVNLAISGRIEEHEHVLRLAVRSTLSEAPQTAILKRWRRGGQKRYDRDNSKNHFFNDWTGLQFLSEIMGVDAPAPVIYAADQTLGYLVIEDISGPHPLSEAMWGSDSKVALKAMARYGDLLGTLHSRTFSSTAVYLHIRSQIGAAHPPGNPDYDNYFQKSIEALKKFDIELSRQAIDDIEKTALILSKPGGFSTFTHGDPVFGNIVERNGRWYFIDFEAAGLRHALLEGAFPRMFFPTSGLKFVLRLPEDVWRVAEGTYRDVLSQHIPAARDDSIFGTAMTAACAFWVLEFCQNWLGRAIDGNDPHLMVERIRQCAIARCQAFVMTSWEFQSLTGLGELFEKLTHRLRAEWEPDTCDLPPYPAFIE